VIVENTSAAVLYGRAMEALSDWTGADGRSKAEIDFSDKDAGTVIHRGLLFRVQKNNIRCRMGPICRFYSEGSL